MIIKNRTGQLARERNLSTRELAAQAGIAYNTALSMMRGSAERVDLGVLARVCEALHVQPGDILVLEVNESESQHARRQHDGGGEGGVGGARARTGRPQPRPPPQAC